MILPAVLFATGTIVPRLLRLVTALICVASDVLILVLLAALLAVLGVSTIFHVALIISVIGMVLLMLARLVMVELLAESRV
jgi:hypothetical protein